MFKSSKTKALVLSIMMIFSLLLSGCMDADYKETKLENGEKCYYNVDDSGISMLKGIDVFKASRDEILKLQSDEVDKPEAKGKIENAEQAAIRGTEVLNEVYDNWTYQDNTIVVRYNQFADVWYAFGQVKDRNSVQDVGNVIFDAKSGEVLFICLAHPED